jgi:hypothetical protein
MPRVAVPLLDQKAEEYAGLLDLVLPLFGIGASGPQALDAWRQVFEDWRPGDSAAADGDRVPRVGFTALHEVITAVGSAAGDMPGKMNDLLGIIQDLEAHNSSFVGMADGQAEGGRATWRSAVDRKITTLETILKDLVEQQ